MAVRILNLTSIISPNITKYVNCFNCSDRSLTDRDRCSNLVSYINRAIDKCHEILRYFKKILIGK